MRATCGPTARRRSPPRRSASAAASRTSSGAGTWRACRTRSCSTAGRHGRRLRRLGGVDDDDRHEGPRVPDAGDGEVEGGEVQPVEVDWDPAPETYESIEAGEEL
jgi:hypothetical protein